MHEIHIKKVYLTHFLVKTSIFFWPIKIEWKSYGNVVMLIKQTSNLYKIIFNFKICFQDKITDNTRIFFIYIR